MWLAKHYQSTREQQYVGVLEAHFAGTRDDCLRFKQTHGAVPSYSACCVKRDLTGTTGDLVLEDQPVHSTQVDMQRWTVTSDIQNAADNGEIMKLPEGLFDLDDQQQKILFRRLPLVLESRSGTGEILSTLYVDLPQLVFLKRFVLDHRHALQERPTCSFNTRSAI